MRPWRNGGRAVRWDLLLDLLDFAARDRLWFGNALKFLAIS
jgi:hypothetical protein